MEVPVLNTNRGYNLETILSDYDTPIGLLSNLNVDIVTFNESRFENLKACFEDIGVKRVFIVGNLWSALGDYDTFARYRDWTSTHVKRKVTNEESKFFNKELNQLTQKVEYVAEIFKDWKVNEINYILGDHDRLIMIARTVAGLNDLISRYDMNTLRSLGESKGRKNYIMKFLDYLLEKYPSLPKKIKKNAKIQRPYTKSLHMPKKDRGRR